MAILYLSYDGMTDQLGAAQVLPYLQGLAALGHNIDLVSFEKPGRPAAEWARARAICDAAGIRWHPQRYTKFPPIASTLYDVIKMRRAAARLHAERNFAIVHCRSYLAALVGLAMKRKHRLHFLFDMRGFWVDERIDGGQWRLANPAYRLVYDWFKRREIELLAGADHIVSLTEAAKHVLLARADRVPDGPPISVIPCCVDFDLFRPPSAEAKVDARRRLNITGESPVALYTGSVGGWYLPVPMFDTFRLQLNRDPTSIFLFITRDDPAPIYAMAKARGVPPSALRLRAATREEVAPLSAAADYALFYIKPSFSKIASCPTKLGEFLAMGLPVVTNGGVGDVATIVEESGAGVLVERFDQGAYRAALARLDALPRRRTEWREKARRWFDLDTGIDRYDSLYRAASSDRKSLTSRGACDASE